MKIELPLAQALPLADKIKAALSPGCDRIAIAGSIRRCKRTVGDIEIVAIPKKTMAPMAQLSLFGDPPSEVSELDILLQNMCNDKENFSRGNKNGDYYKNFLIELAEDGEDSFGLDLFLTTPSQWGYILALRTGPGDFNKAWVTQKSRGGLLYDGFHFAGGWLRAPDGTKIVTPEERVLFSFIEGGAIPPSDRDNWRLKYRHGSAV